MYKFVWRGERVLLESASTILSEIAWPPADAVSLTEDAGAWRLEAYFDGPSDIASIGRLTGLAAPTLEELPDIDWVAHSLAGLGIVEAGRFLLYGAHDAAKTRGRDDAIAIRIDANQAFGTGHHPTTAGCLALLSRFEGLPPDRILDLGCGSGVLAIAAAKLWDRRVVASDIDEKSLAIARENAALNGVGDRVETILADGFANPVIAARAPFDFIFANILAGPLIALARAMSAHAETNGRVMLAGFMADQEEDVASAYREAGFRTLNRLDHETWPVLLLVQRA